MKVILNLALLLLLSFNSISQCFDIYGRNATCPTENDSLIVYNNALKVYEFYEKNPDYVKLKTQRLRTKQDVINCFYQLQDAVDSFQMRWQLRERVINGEDIPSVLLPRDGKNIPLSDYYQYIDENIFYQRELENGILNISSPFPIYDIRIAPLIINSYENRYSYDEFNGDFVNVALYIPVTVKPYRLLSDSEKIERQKILNGIIVKKKSNLISPQKPTKINKKIIDTTLLKSANINYVPPLINKEFKFTYPPSNAVPMYYYNYYGAGTLMGYMVGRKFRKVLPTDEYYWAMPKWLKEFLNDDSKLERYLKIELGGYYDGIYK
jgi:hypothetical protein